VWEELKGDLRDPAVLGPIKALLESAPENLGNALRAAKNAVIGILAVLGELAPEARKFWQWLADITAEFKNWATSEEGRKQIRDFFERVWPVVRDVARAVWSLITGLVKAGTSGPALKFFDHLAWFMEQIGIALPIIVQGLRPLNWALDSLRWIIEQLDYYLGPVVEEIASWMGLDWPGFAAAIIGVALAFALFLGTVKLLRGFYETIRSVFGGLGSILDSFGRRGRQRFGEFDAAKDKTKRNVQDFGTKARTAFGTATAAVGRFAGSRAGLAAMAVAVVGAGVGLTYLAQSASQMLGQMMNISTFLPQIVASVGSVFTYLQGLLSQSISYVQNLATQVIQYVTSLPAMVMQYVGALASQAVTMVQTLATQLVTFVTTLVSQTISYITQVGTQVVSYLTQLVSQTVSYMTQLSTQSINYLTTLASQTISYLTQLASQTIGYLQSLAAPVVSYLQQLASSHFTYLQSIVTQTLTLLQTLAPGVYTHLQQLASGLMTHLATVAQTVGSTLQTIASTASTTLQTVVTRVSSFLGTASSTILSGIQTLGSGIYSNLQTTGSRAISTVTTVASGVAAVASRAFSDLATDLGYAWDGISAVLGGALTDMAREWDIWSIAIPAGILSKAPRMARAAITFGSKAREMLPYLNEVLFGESGVTGKMNEIALWLEENATMESVWSYIGSTWVGSVLRGFSDWWTDYAWPYLRDWGNSVIKFINGVFDMASPSKVFMDIGMNLSKGLAEGMKKGLKYVSAMSDEMRDAATITPLLSVPVIDAASAQSLALQRQQLSTMQGQSSMLAARQKQEITVQLLLERRLLAEQVVDIMEERNRNQRRRGVR
jgi:phage-related protein